MLIVYFESQAGMNDSFQMPCRLAGSEPGRLLSARR